MLIVLGCGDVSIETPLSVQSPVKEAHVSTFGWSRDALGQEIRVTLEPGVSPRSVVDLSIFGSLQPGMTLDEAAAVEGRPSRVWDDRYGQTWHAYERAHGVVEVGCQCDSSGTSVTARCTWALQALSRNGWREDGLAPQLRAFLGVARGIPERTLYRAIEVGTSDHTEHVSWYIESSTGSPRLYWYRTLPKSVAGAEGLDSRLFAGWRAFSRRPPLNSLLDGLRKNNRRGGIRVCRASRPRAQETCGRRRNRAPRAPLRAPRQPALPAW
jgi:hypothetical protein